MLWWRVFALEIPSVSEKERESEWWFLRGKERPQWSWLFSLQTVTCQITATLPNWGDSRNAEMTPQFDNFLIYGRISGITMSCTVCFRVLLRLKWFPVHHTQICKSVLDFLILNFKFFFNILQLLIQFMQKGSAILELALILKAINFIF